MKKLFLLGDFSSNNGPANANKQIVASLPKDGVMISSEIQKFGRILEVCKGIVFADVLIVCSKSNLNYFAMVLAKIMKKKILYIMHGYSSYEGRINNPEISEKKYRKLKSYDMFVIQKADTVICVSKKNMEFMRNEFLDYSRKFDYIFNIVNIPTKQQTFKSENHAKRDVKVLSTGGGLKRKNNLIVADALQTVKSSYAELTYTVVGEEFQDGVDIKKYKFVKWNDSVSHERIIEIMSESYLYIQNSKIETFGLAVIEALFSGCNILISNNIGCCDLFTTLTEDDVIYNVDNKDELTKKIYQIFARGNNKRLIEGFKYECITNEWLMNKFDKIISDLYV